MSALDFEDADLAAVQEVLYAPALDAELRGLMGERWMGWIGPNESFPADPEPSSELRTPTCWGQWEVDYPEPPQRTMEGAVGHYSGVVVLVIRIQDGAGDQRARKALRAALAALEDASTDSRALLYDNRSTLPSSGGYTGRQVTLRLVGAG